MMARPARVVRSALLLLAAATGAVQQPLHAGQDGDARSLSTAAAAASTTSATAAAAVSPQLKVSLKAIEDGAKAATTTLVNAARTVVDRAGDDLRTIWDAGSECLAAVDDVRLVFTHHATDLLTASLEELARAKVLPTGLVKRVHSLVNTKLQADPRPRLWRVTNLGAAAWGGEPEAFVPVRRPAELAEAVASAYRSYLLVHGAFYSGKTREAYEDFVRPWERAVRVFKNGTDRPADCFVLGCNVFVLTYDTEMTDEAQTIILKGFESVLLGTVTATGPLLVGAVFWRELERRAKIAGEFLAPFLAAVPAGQDVPFFVFSHSLGTFTTAHAAQRLYDPTQGDVGGRVRKWYAAAAAVPATAFTPGSGLFDRAPRLVTSYEGPAISVMYSNLDSVLTTMYVWANGQLAMGAVGSRSPGEPAMALNRDVTALVKTVHGSSDGYWQKVQNLLRVEFGTS